MIKVKFVVDQEKGPGLSDNKTEEFVLRRLGNIDRALQDGYSGCCNLSVGSELGFTITRALLSSTFKHLHKYFQWFVVVEGKEVEFRVDERGRVEAAFWENYLKSYWDIYTESILSNLYE